MLVQERRGEIAMTRRDEGVGKAAVDGIEGGNRLVYHHFLGTAANKKKRFFVPPAADYAPVKKIPYPSRRRSRRWETVLCQKGKRVSQENVEKVQVSPKKPRPQAPAQRKSRLGGTPMMTGDDDGKRRRPNGEGRKKTPKATRGLKKEKKNPFAGKKDAKPEGRLPGRRWAKLEHLPLGGKLRPEVNRIERGEGKHWILKGAKKTVGVLPGGKELPSIRWKGERGENRRYHPKKAKNTGFFSGKDS